MKTLAIINEKGGSGKTTIATSLATALHRRGSRVVLIDADPQGTATDWRAASPEGANLPPVVAVNRPQELEAALRGLDADFVVIDTPARASQIAAAVVRVANIALIVIQPSGPDVWAAAATVKLIRSRKQVGGEIDAAFLVNRAAANTKLSKAIRDGEWNEYGIDQMTATVGNRVSFAIALTEGVSVFDLADTTAQTEINNVIQELEAAKWL